MKMSMVILGVLAATGCRQQVHAKQPVETAPFRVQMSGVHFDGDEAVECIDMTATADTSNLAKRPASDRAKAEQMVTDLLSSRLKNIGVVLIQQPCGQQFRGRPIFARCILAPSNDGPLAISIQTSFLSFDYVYGNDRNMKDCLSAQGQWDEMPHDSSEFIQAKLHRDTKTIQRLTGVR